MKTLPTLFLGLGGTGKDTLMHLRRLFLDEYSAGGMPSALQDKYGPARLPHTAYLCVDADSAMEDLDGHAFDEFMERAKLTEGEFLDVELNAEKVRALYDQPERYPEYARWFDFGLEKSGVPSHGCGQTRPWGRMAFFQHYGRIRDRLKTILSSLVVVTTANDARAIGVEDLVTDKVRVFVIFSVAGGTGSGMFMDMAFLLKDLGKEIGVELDIEAMIVLPEVFASNPTSRVYANAYAALTEIEYYNLRREGAADLDATSAAKGGEGLFPIYWPGRTPEGSSPLYLRGPVFEPVWLIGARSRGIDGQGAGTVVSQEHKSELAGMIADWLFLRTAPRMHSMGDDINSRASNYAAQEMVKTAAIPVYEMGEEGKVGAVELSCRYGSFGLAKVFSPVNVTSQMAGDQLISDILTDWLRATNASPSDDELDREIRPKVRLRVASQDGADTRHEDTLYDVIDREGRTGGAGIVSEAVDAYRGQFHPSIAEDAGDMLATQLKDRFRDYQWGATSTQITDSGLRGQYANRVRSSASLQFNEVQAGLNQIVADALNDPARRFPYAQNVLVRLAVEFTDLAGRAEARAHDTGSRLSDVQQDMSDLLGHAANERSRFVLRQIAKVAIDYQADVVRFELEVQVWSAVAAGAKEMASLIGSAGVDDAGAGRASMLKELDELKTRITELGKRFTDRVEGLANRHDSILNKALVPRERNLYYVDTAGAPIGREFVRAAELTLYGDPNIFKGGEYPSPWALRKRFRGAEREVVLNALSAAGLSRMGQIDRPNDVTALLDHAYEGDGTDREYANAIRQNVQSGTAWLATRSLGLDGEWQSVLNYTVALNRRSGVSSQRLENVFRNTFGEARAVFIDGPPDVIYFEQELAAFPLSVVPNIRDWRDRSYLPLLLREAPAHSEAQGGGGGLHIELNVEKYIDIVEPTREEASRRSEAILLFIEALVKGRLHPGRDRFGLVHYSFNRLKGLEVRSFQFGRYDRAIRALSNNLSEETRQLRAQVEDVEQAWDAAPDRGLVTKARILVILDRYMNQPDLSPVRGKDWVRCVTRLNSRFIQRWGKETFEAALKERESIETWGVKSPAGGEHILPPDLPKLRNE